MALINIALRFGICDQEYREIFGNSDEELDGDDSDIDFVGFEVDGDEESNNNSEETSDVEAEEETLWMAELSNFVVSKFSGEPGLLVDFEDDAKADDYFLSVFREESVDSIVEETNRFARQSLQNNARRLAAWKDITKLEMKAFFGICVIMGINQLPKVADYWKDDPFIGNEGIKRTMPRNRFQKNIAIFALRRLGEKSSTWQRRLRSVVQSQTGSKCHIREQSAMLFTRQTHCRRRRNDCFRRKTFVLAIRAGETDEVWHKSVDGGRLKEWLRRKFRCLPWKQRRRSKNSWTWL